MLEQEDIKTDDQEPKDGTIDLEKELIEKIKPIWRLFNYGEAGKIGFSDGSRMRVDLIMNDRDLYSLEILMVYYPDEDKPKFHHDHFTKPIAAVINHIKRNIPEIESYPKDILHKFSIKIVSETSYPLEGVIKLLDGEMLSLFERNRILNPLPLDQALFDFQDALNDYVLYRPPVFSSDYVNVMKKAMKKMYTIYKALQKGTFKGRSYELHEGEPLLVIHQNRSRYNKEQRIIYPDFNLTISARDPKKIDGIDYIDFIVNQRESGEGMIYVKELNEFLKQRFLNFGITYR